MPLMSHQKKIILAVVAFIVLIIILGVFFRKIRPAPVALEFWGISDEPAVFSSLVQDFKKEYPHVSINYTLKDQNTYHEDLLKALADNKAPDILMLQDNWLPHYEDKIYPLDLTKDKYFNLLDLEQTFSQISRNKVVKDNYLLGLPLYTDILALYYNKDIFNNYNIVLPPTTWEEVLNLITTLRRVNPQGQITRAAIALGSSSNVNWEVDIVSVLMMQYGSEIIDATQKKAIFNSSIDKDGKKIIPGEEALSFYTQFNDPYSRYYTWNDNFDDSAIAFSRGETVMMIGYNKDKETINRYGSSLNYGVAPLPQFANSSSKINYGQTMVLSVLQSSKHLQESWNFLKFLSQKNNAQKYFLQTKKLPTRLDLIQEYLNDLDSGIFIREIATSRNWYQYDFKDVNTVFKEMVEAVTYKGDSSLKAVNGAVEKINYFWNQK